MAIVRDREGNILNPQHALRSRYTDESLTSQDWFTLHPEAKKADATAPSDNDVPPVSVSTGSVDTGLAGEPAVPQSTGTSEQSTNDLPKEPATGDGL